MVIATLHIHPKQKFEAYINEYGDIYVNNEHYGELNLNNQQNTAFIGITGPTGPSCIGLKGYRGEPGPQGLTGIIGNSITGPMGLEGPNGFKGQIGRLGIKGPTGPQGVQGPTGPKGPTLYANPRNFLYAKIDKNFQFSDERLGNNSIIPWYHIANNGFTISNTVIKFPSRYGVYKIECGLQITNFTSTTCQHTAPELYKNCIQIELCFKRGACKSYNTIIPLCCKGFAGSSSMCETLHYTHIVQEYTEMTIAIKTCGLIQDIHDTMYLCIMEIH